MNQNKTNKATEDNNSEDVKPTGEEAGNVTSEDDALSNESGLRSGRKNPISGVKRASVQDKAGIADLDRGLSRSKR
jgi:hypothetical protein